MLIVIELFVSECHNGNNHYSRTIMVVRYVQVV